MSITFDYPMALWLLVLVPVLYLIGRYGTAYLPRTVRRAAIVVRLLLATALILAIAQPVLHRASDLLSVAFVVDQSASTAVGQSSAANAWLAQALQTQGARDQVAIVDFGKNAVLTRPMGVTHNAAGVPKIDPSQSDLAAGIHLASSLFPPDGAHRIVVLSDGQTNSGDAAAAAREASLNNDRIDVVPIGPPPGFKEVLIDSVSAPAATRLGQSFDVGAVVRSSVTTDAKLTFFMDGKPVSQDTVHVKPGVNRYSINLALNDKGFHSFSAQIQSPVDTYAQNNAAYGFTVVDDAGKVAVVAANATEAAPIVQALQRSQVQVTTLVPSAIPPTLSAMNQYDAMVVVDTPATAFSLDQMKTIAAFAHDLGRGLVFIGGPNSYGQGKYDGTPLSDALPVDSGVPGNVSSGSVAVVIVIDKSGSMDEDMGGAKKMAAADKAAQLAAGLLAPTDQIGIIAFDTDPTAVVPLQQVGDKAHLAQIQGQIGQISASGGTDIYAGLKSAYDQIHLSKARYKHIILMSDGNSLTDSNYAQLLQNIQQEQITLSTIAIGSDADQKLMQMLATQGGGKYYYTQDATKIPEITTRETQVKRGSAKVDETFKPTIVSPSSLLDGFSGASLPNLNGYVVATPKPNATVALQSDRKDPILVQWNYGLGRVVAWMSDLSSPWGADWVKWSDFTRFWSQGVGWSMRAPGDPNMQMSYSVDGNKVTFTVDVVNDQGVFQDLLDLRAQVVGSDGKPVEVPLTESRPGRYEHTFVIDQPGAYPVQVLQYSGGKVVSQTTSGMVVSYPAEYRDFGVNDENLASLAALTGGQVLHAPADAFSRQGVEFSGMSSLPLWHWLLYLAAALFPIDVAIRRLRVDPVDLAKRGARGGGTGLRRGGAWLGRRTNAVGGLIRRRQPAETGG
ncbi:MAG TPA: VWA domain-containing protein [Chloroflexota bacterium]|nr:VWA domain-containing protein [Chloroflexota bacterium]